MRKLIAAFLILTIAASAVASTQQLIDSASALSGTGIGQSDDGSTRGGTTYRVGTGCTYSTIQSAIDAIPSTGSGIVRIRGGTYNERVAITNKSVELIGGHNDCSTTSPTGSSTIDASGGTAPAIAYFALGVGSSYQLTAERLILSNGTGNSVAPGGGLSISTGAGLTVSVLLSQTTVSTNLTEYRGGGIALFGAGNASLTLLENTIINSNAVNGSDPNGGGLYCQGDHSVLMIGGSIYSNIAGLSSVSGLGFGGGIYLDGCDMTWFAQNQTSPGTDDASLRNNVSYGFGGGLLATGGAQVRFVGATFSLNPTSSRPLRIRDNDAFALPGPAGGLGGGIYAFGAGTEVTVDRGWIHDNFAAIEGGAATVRGGATLNIRRSSEVCHSPTNCSRIYNNFAGQSGSAVHAADEDTLVLIQRTRIENHTNGLLGPPAFRGVLTTANDGVIRLEDSLMFGNVGFGHAMNASSSGLEVRRTTIADTEPPSDAGVFGLSGDSNVVIVDSIIHEEQTTRPMYRLYGGTPTVSADCVVWHDDSLAVFVIGSTRSVLADPLFADRAQDLFYLKPGSPAINLCNFPPPAPAVDIDWNPRGLCHSTSDPCGAFIYDVGAYEYPLGIFSDRFEN